MTLGLAQRFQALTSGAAGFLRELVRRERLGAVSDEQARRSAGTRPHFFSRLLERETLPPAARENAPAPAPEPAFLRTLFAREHLPVSAPPPAAKSGQGFLSWILGRETLQSCATGGATAREPGFLAQLLEREALPRDPAPTTAREPSFLRRLLSSESLEERDDGLAD